MRFGKDAHLKIPLALVPLAALLLTTGPLFAQRSKPPARPPISTAANLPAHVAVKGALKVALGDSAVRAAAHKSVSAYMSHFRPFAVVNGYWVVSYPLRVLYSSPPIKAALLSTLGANGQQVIDAAGNSTNVHSLALILVPLALEKFLQNFSADLRSCVGSFTVNATAPWLHPKAPKLPVPTTIILSLSSGVARVFGVDTWDPYTDAGTDRSRDLDGDNETNQYDDDDDGDGKVDSNDVYPFDPARKVCACGQVAAIAFTSNVAREFLPDLVSNLNAARAALPNGTSLGLGSAFVGGNPTGAMGTMTVVF